MCTSSEKGSGRKLKYDGILKNETLNLFYSKRFLLFVNNGS
jgi:hypothetical protein